MQRLPSSLWPSLLAALLSVHHVHCQDYYVSDIHCTFGGSSGSDSAAAAPGVRDSISARLRKPEGFRGSPLFADERQADPLTDPVCQIRPEPADPEQLSYRLLVTDFSRCGVLRRNGFVHVRIWFPQFPGVVMMSDQELIIMCKPPEPTIIENKAAGFAGSFAHGARVSGVAEESPGRLEYEVALYKEAPPARVGNLSGELPVDQAVPIGTKLQLRARINPDSAWKFVKLTEVAVSPDADDPHAAGSVALVKDGCRNNDFVTIIPHQPARYRDRNNEVFLDFEAFLLSGMQERATLWIHSQIKACMDAADCQPEYCLDVLEPAGHGRKRRDEAGARGEGGGGGGGGAGSGGNSSEQAGEAPAGPAQAHHAASSARFRENIEFSVLMPGDLYRRPGQGAALTGDGPCSTMALITGLLGTLLFLATLAVCYLATRLRDAASVDRALRHAKTGGYTGRSLVQ
ncbi:uncharacterized protein LOC126251319 [Schistocerca nitens]|uniref:uncharacterized protein LOC126251319 n=1 Tax=Schistocerca nitens TaxID=7011 RepID=UPI0021193024|nr:uncharacterized protein LOC126251319 [Schistocerca nitens]